jgi:DnaJ-domain-containing protein 1
MGLADFFFSWTYRPGQKTSDHYSNRTRRGFSPILDDPAFWDYLASQYQKEHHDTKNDYFDENDGHDSTRQSSKNTTIAVGADIRECCTVLGITYPPSIDAIKSAYRSIAQDCHPDRTNGDSVKTERFIKATRAYDLLRMTLEKRE